MKIYKHEGNGHYVGSYIVVVAPNIERATELICHRLIQEGLPDEELNITEFKTNKEAVILSVNGDY